jgi:hypothetical protein
VSLINTQLLKEQVQILVNIMQCAIKNSNEIQIGSLLTLILIEFKIKIKNSTTTQRFILYLKKRMNPVYEGCVDGFKTVNYKVLSIEKSSHLFTRIFIYYHFTLK